MSEKKYSITIIVKSGNRELTNLVYPDMDYSELVQVEAAISFGLVRAGVQRAVAMGEELPQPMLDMFDVEGK